MPGVQVDLLLRAIQPGTDRAVSLAAIQVINEQGLYLPGRRRSMSLTDLLHGADQPGSPERQILRCARAAVRVPGACAAGTCHRPDVRCQM